LRNGGTGQILKNNPNETKFYSEKYLEQTEVRECLLSFGAEYCLPVCYPKIKIYNLACCFAWV